jgi:hypothetical protein
VETWKLWELPHPSSSDSSLGWKRYQESGVINRMNQFHRKASFEKLIATNHVYLVTIYWCFIPLMFTVILQADITVVCCTIEKFEDQKS